MPIPFKYMKPAIHALDPEVAHKVTICAAKNGLMPSFPPINDPRLQIKLWDRHFPNPIGPAAGFDKDAEAIPAIFKMGFGFVEVGTVTPLPQIGNTKPRIFRDVGNEAVINRMGFPNKGLEFVKHNIKKFHTKNPNAVLGINIGMNKEQEEPVKDYRLLIRELIEYAHYFTINISSPNTPGLRNLQQREHLLPLIHAVQEERASVYTGDSPPPLLIKLAPDLDKNQQSEIAQTVMEAKVDGLILGNTTLDRPDFLPRKFSREAGGLSGKPLTDKSTQIISNFYKLTDGQIPIIGVGGISSAQDVYDKLRAGASLVQLYSALVFHGPELVTQICNDLLDMMEENGIDSISKITETQQ